MAKLWQRSATSEGEVGLWTTASSLFHLSSCPVRSVRGDVVSGVRACEATSNGLKMPQKLATALMDIAYFDCSSVVNDSIQKYQ
jgi:hypothetical protein